MTTFLKDAVRFFGLSGWRSHRILLQEVRQFDPEATLSRNVFKFCDLVVDVSRFPWMVDVLAPYAKSYQKGGLAGRFEADRLVVKYESLEFSVKSGMELAIVGEIFSEGIYRVVLDQKPVIVDIGANIGIAATYFASQLGLRVYAYELVPEVAQRAQEHVERNDLTALVTVHPAGLAAKAAEIDVVFDSNITGATSMYLNTGASEKQTTVRCALRSVVEEFESVFAAHADVPVIVKMDCEGAEYELLEQMERSGLLGRVTGFLMEYHNVSGLKNVSYLEALLTRNGYVVHARVVRGKEYEMIYAFRLA